MVPIKQSKKGDALMNKWLILRNSTIIFPFASRVRSEARVMSNHCQQPNATAKKKEMLRISVSITLTQTTHKIVMACNTEWRAGSSTGIGASFFNG